MFYYFTKLSQSFSVKCSSENSSTKKSMIFGIAGLILTPLLSYIANLKAGKDINNYSNKMAEELKKKQIDMQEEFDLRKEEREKKRLKEEEKAHKQRLEEEEKMRLRQEEQRKRQVEIDLEAYRKKLEIEKKNRLEQFEIEKKVKEEELAKKNREIRKTGRAGSVKINAEELITLEKEAFDKVKFLLRTYTGIPALTATFNLLRQGISYGTVDFLDIQNLLSAVLITGAIIVWSDTNSIVRMIMGEKNTKPYAFNWSGLSPRSKGKVLEDPKNLKLLSTEIEGGNFTSDEEKEVLKIINEKKNRKMLKAE